MRVEYEVSGVQDAVGTQESILAHPAVSDRAGLRLVASKLPLAGVRHSRIQVALKRAMDIGLALLVLPVLLPVCGIVVLSILLTSPGPIFFSHRRICRNGGFFSMWKFRTMCTNSAEVLERYLATHPDARKEWLANHKLRQDPRVTRLGDFLRRYSLDELPQIWNVLTGKMSMVGPRPIVAAEVEKYGDRFCCYASVKPGVTGLWQVSGRSRLSYDERVALDCQYAQEWSIWMDIKILSRTFASVVNSDGAY
jgi:Undecaprenyl-phosphate galactose phosphotransferase WbaP